MSQLTLIIGNKNYSSWSLRPWLALKQADIPFEEIRIPLDQPDTKSRILHYNPAGKVPVLLVDAQPIWDSLAICEYLAETYPAKRLWPADPRARALARSACAEMHAGFAELRKQLPMDMRSSYPGKTYTAAAERDIERILALWQDCRSRFGQGGAFLFGEFSIADAFYAPVATRLVTYGVALPEFAQRYVDALYRLPAMQEWLAAARAEEEMLTY